MYIYNITIKVDNDIHRDWLNWMRYTHLEEIMQTGCFVKNQMVRLLEADDEEGPTYAIQLYAASIDDYNRYIDHFSDELRRKSFEKWDNKFIAFRSLMQIVH